MSNPSWTKKLASRLIALHGTINTPARVTVLGIGNELNGDDAAGVIIARRLAASLTPREHLLVLEAGPVPENFTGLLRRFRPDLVLLVDAGDFGGGPGDVALIDWQEAGGFSASTHTFPPSILAGYLRAELSCEISILAVQAAQTVFDAPLSPQVERAIEDVIKEIAQILASAQ